MRAIEEILAMADGMFEKNDVKGVERLYLDSLKEAEEENNTGIKLHIYNELIGYYRQLSKREELLSAIEGAMKTAEEMHLEGSVPYGTTLLNAATGYRSLGIFDKAENYYRQVECIYNQALQPEDMLFANLYNNMSLLYQEQKEYGRAEECLLKALSIAKKNQAGFEIPVTYANLANTGILAREYEKAKAYAKQSITGFEERGSYNPHYGAALSALGMCCYAEGNINQAKELFEKALKIVETCVGKNVQYERIMEYLAMCEQGEEGMDMPKKGLSICKAYYETYGAPMIAEKFPAYRDKIAVGLVGEGSDCFGYDDEISRDHDWGPGFCMWVTDATYEEIGEELAGAYQELPKEFMGFKVSPVVQGASRRGVIKISDFYTRLLGADSYSKIDWRYVEDYALAAATNGQVFVDEEGVFSEFRNQLMKGYPEQIWFAKLAQDVAGFSQTGQYNYKRMADRGDDVTADRMLSDCLGHIMRLMHHMNNHYPPHEKWLMKSLEQLEGGMEVSHMVKELHGCLKDTDLTHGKEQVLRKLEGVGDYFARELYARDAISDINPYLDFHTEELLKKSSYGVYDREELVEQVVRLEFRAFDLVKNEGGRAYCQNDWPTFSVMRKSQYLTWNRTMLLQYLYDFSREFELGHNLITEKYGRMMESTAPEEYARIAEHFPPISPQKKAIIEQIVGIQMNMVEEFAKDYPKVVGNARNLHTYEDNIIDTSYETYLRGEISTYSDKMLQLYGKYVITCAKEGENIARRTIENTAKLYGYSGLDEFEGAI